MTGVPIIRGEDTQEHREEGDGKMEAKTGVMLSQAKYHLKTPKAGRGKGGFFLRDSTGSTARLIPTLISDLKLPEL